MKPGQPVRVYDGRLAFIEERTEASMFHVMYRVRFEDGTTEEFDWWSFKEISGLEAIAESAE